MSVTSKTIPDRDRTQRPHRAIVFGTLGGLLLVALAVGLSRFDNAGPHHSSGAMTPTVVGGTATAEVSLTEFRISPRDVAVAKGTDLRLVVRNNGDMEHDLRLSNGVHTALLAPGRSQTIDVGHVEKDLDGWCTVPGHRAAGMTMHIKVLDTPVQPAAPSSAPMQSSSQDARADDLRVSPPADWKPIDAAVPPASSATVHRLTWHIRDVETWVAPGVKQTLWTFDGRVPGPVLRGHVGDVFEVTVVNDTSMTHNLDFHVETGPPAETMPAIPPGGRHTYSFVARYAGAWLYHCGTEPMLMHIANGMYGALIIDPPGLAPVDDEYVLVGSEFFFGPPVDAGDYAKMLADRADTVVFNGYPFAYLHRPIAARVGDRVRIWVVDAGPNRALAFHVIGSPFTTVYSDGHYLLGPSESTSSAAQTLAVDPGAGGFVEFTVSRPGDYPFLSHVAADATLGAMGILRVRP
ncbi:MAG: multicopper oxidase domain-containing protein [Acidothermus sp.]|nr:multicopper oxidase domain-containing protein [Acidothermus sp.]MCL6538556.1 multicopper oxidase domain-containing protein [Acidothermus sp.]